MTAHNIDDQKNFISIFFGLINQLAKYTEILTIYKEDNENS